MRHQIAVMLKNQNTVQPYPSCLTGAPGTSDYVGRTGRRIILEILHRGKG